MGASEQTGTLDGQRHNGAVSSQAFSEVAGGVCAAKGFAAGGIHAGFRKDPARLDMALVVADAPCAAAGTFTTNRFCAAPVQVSRAHLGAGACYGTARAVVINSGNANAATGEPGLACAEWACAHVAAELGCAAEDVLVASTGVIGVQLPFVPYEAGVPAAVASLAATPAAAHDAACAVMTTDTVPKEVSVAGELPHLLHARERVSLRDALLPAYWDIYGRIAVLHGVQSLLVGEQQSAALQALGALLLDVGVLRLAVGRYDRLPRGDIQHARRDGLHPVELAASGGEGK